MDDKIFGKPQNKDHAIAMLLEFSGRKHSVMTCVCLGETDLQSDADVKMTFDLVRTEIQFANLSANQCAKYWETNEPKDKAGAYGIQGYGALLNLWREAIATLLAYQSLRLVKFLKKKILAIG
jgi:septum formation protein